MTFALATTNPIQVETGIEYFLPTDDLHWIPNGWITIDLTVDKDDLEDDFYGTLDEVARKWCDHNGVEFSQVIMEP